MSQSSSGVHGSGSGRVNNGPNSNSKRRAAIRRRQVDPLILSQVDAAPPPNNGVDAEEKVEYKEGEEDDDEPGRNDNRERNAQFSIRPTIAPTPTPANRAGTIQSNNGQCQCNKVNNSKSVHIYGVMVIIIALINTGMLAQIMLSSQSCTSMGISTLSSPSPSSISMAPVVSSSPGLTILINEFLMFAVCQWIEVGNQTGTSINIAPPSPSIIRINSSDSLNLNNQQNAAPIIDPPVMQASIKGINPFFCQCNQWVIIMVERNRCR
jgi:hypothetical protein